MRIQCQQYLVVDTNVHIKYNLLTCAVESYPTPGDIDDRISPTPPTS